MSERGYETIEFSRDGHIGWLRLNRPDKLNSFTVLMWREMRAIGRELKDDDDLRALVVIGNGRAFSSGIDTSVFTGSGGADALDEPDEPDTHADPTVSNILRVQQSYSWLQEARYPTIAAVRGYALGAGLQLALACDIRVFARGTSVGLLEHKYGILPDLGGTQRLPRVVGAGKAKELIWTAARIDAEEAYRIGLCERLVDDDALDAEAAALADRIASAPPLAVQGAKRAVEAAGRVPIAEGLVVEAEAQAVALRSDDMREAITAFVEQRDPKYTGR
jgi:enoyl-CoA hydratase/carnithine racemase